MSAVAKMRAALDQASVFEPPAVAEPNNVRPIVKAPTLELVDAANLAGREAPARQWIWDGVFPRRTVVLVSGVGGAGKSTLALRIGVAVALGEGLFGRDTHASSVLLFSCEDDQDELHRRLERLRRSTGQSLDGNERLLLAPRVGGDNVLVAHDQRTGLAAPTPTYDVLLAAAKAHHVRLLIIDTVAQTFAGNENDRSQVTAYVNALARIAQEIDGCVLLLAHPPKNGAEFSGSTAWDGTVRARLALESRQDDDGSKRLYLRLAKANYAEPFEVELLRDEHGVFWSAEHAPPSMADKIDAYRGEAEAKTAFLAALAELTSQGRSVSHSPNAKNYAPKAIVQAGLVDGHSIKALDLAMQALFREGVIRADQPVGRTDRRQTIRGIARVAPTATTPAEEALADAN
jgi:RecA-family ATPase